MTTSLDGSDGGVDSELRCFRTIKGCSHKIYVPFLWLGTLHNVSLISRSWESFMAIIPHFVSSNLWYHFEFHLVHFNWLRLPLSLNSTVLSQS